MTCEVSLCEWDGDSAEFYNESVVKARKAHACHECRQPIEPGQDYERITGKWDGHVETYRFCMACSEIQREFSENGRVFGNMWEDFRENWRSGANLQACMNRVSTVAAKSKLRDEWQQWKGLR